MSLSLITPMPRIISRTISIVGYKYECPFQRMVDDIINYYLAKKEFYVEEIFGQNGLIARAHPDYEYRAGQVAMAEAVLRAFEENRYLIVEAGIGKPLTYFIFSKHGNNCLCVIASCQRSRSE